MDNFYRVLRDNPSKCLSKCLDCNDFRWCPYQVWVGEPKDCMKEDKEGLGRQEVGHFTGCVDTEIERAPNFA